MEQSVKDLVLIKLAEMEKKANHNKKETLWCFKAIMLSTLSSPLFISFGVNTFFGKIIPVVLSLIAGLLTAWMQLRKPHNLWSTYRTAQRKLEVELELYQFHIAPYNLEDNKNDEILLKRVHEIYLETHLKWVGLVPSTDDVKAIKNRNMD